jgi:hypothetical protein
VCAPVAVPIALAAASAAQQVASYKAQADEANAAGKFQAKQYSNTASIAMDNYVRTIGTTQSRLQQETAAASQSAIQNHLSAIAGYGTAQTAAVERGVSGNSVSSLLNEFAQLEAQNNDTIYQNLQWEREQSDEELRSARSSAYGQIASATPRPVRGPSGLELGLGLVGAAAEGVDRYQRWNNLPPYGQPKAVTPRRVPGSVWRIE